MVWRIQIKLVKNAYSTFNDGIYYYLKQERARVTFVSKKIDNPTSMKKQVYLKPDHFSASPFKTSPFSYCVVVTSEHSEFNPKIKTK